MIITIDEYSGFCFGVTAAIDAAERELKVGPLFCLGDIVHNGQEVERSISGDISFGASPHQPICSL